MAQAKYNNNKTGEYFTLHYLVPSPFIRQVLFCLPCGLNQASLSLS